MSALAKNSFESSSHGNRGFAETIAKLVSRRQRALPFFPVIVATLGEQIKLKVCVRGIGWFEATGMHSQQANGKTRSPIFAEELTDFGKDFAIQLRGLVQTMSARDGREIGIAQLQLQSARMQLLFPQAAAHHLREPRQSSFELFSGRDIMAEGVFVAD